jgi:uncharacterized membrane-anchored protein
MGKKFDVLIGWDATKLIVEKAIQKLSRLKDLQYTALIALEFILAMVVLFAFLVYIDPSTNKVDPPFNFIITGAIIFAALHLYNYTSNFRKLKVAKRKSSLKIAFLELFIFTIIVVSAYIYQNKTINTLPYPFNFILFLAILSIPLYFYINEKFV